MIDMFMLPSRAAKNGLTRSTVSVFSFNVLFGLVDCGLM